MLCSFLRFIRKIFGKNTKNNLKYYKIYFKSVYKYFFKYTKYFNILVARTGVKGDHRILKINRLTLDYVFINKYSLKMKHTHFFYLRSHDSLVKFNM